MVEGYLRCVRKVIGGMRAAAAVALGQVEIFAEVADNEARRVHIDPR